MGKDSAVLVKALAQNLRQRRVEQGLSLSDLARKSYVAKATLSALESGRGNPTIETISALAHALGVPLGQLLAEPDTSVSVVRARDRVPTPGVAHDVAFLERVVGRSLIEVYEVSCAAGSRRESPAHTPGSVEHVLVTRGRLMTGTLDAPVELREGDFAHFAGDQPHLYAAPAAAARAVVLISYP